MLRKALGLVCWVRGHKWGFGYKFTGARQSILRSCGRCGWVQVPRDGWAAQFEDRGVPREAFEPGPAVREMAERIAEFGAILSGAGTEPEPWGEPPEVEWVKSPFGYSDIQEAYHPDSRGQGTPERHHCTVGLGYTASTLNCGRPVTINGNGDVLALHRDQIPWMVEALRQAWERTAEVTR